MVKYNLVQCTGAMTFDTFGEKSKYYSDIVCFDIETTSYSERIAFMYVWQISINGETFYGRTWSEFYELVNELNTYTEDGKKVIIWVHNLSFEFSFLEGVFKFDKVFATSAHKVVYADYKNIRFRCTYMMSNKSLASIAKDYKLSVQKLKGDLDYCLCRHSLTPLTEQELQYCENDVLVLHHYIKYMLSECGTFATSQMPLTSTGFVRKLIRSNAQKDKQYGVMRKIVKDCSPVDSVLYHMLQRAFGGGQTHANYLRIGEEIDNVTSLDKKSFYPAAMVKHLYPQKFHAIKPSAYFREIARGKAVIADVEFYDLECKYPFCTISAHKCQFMCGKEDITLDNGKVYKAKHLIITLTELDFDTIDKYYKYDKKRLKIGHTYSAIKKRLPKTFIKSVLELYRDKTELKGIEGADVLYMYRKQLLNSTFGMCVTDLLQDSIIYDNNLHTWQPQAPDTLSTLEDYRTNYTSLLLYQTGVYITAYCRHEILENDLYILQKEPLDLIYNDTDSIKCENFELYTDYFTEYDNKVREQMQESCKYYGFPWEWYEPTDQKGRKHLLGTMDNEGTYLKFKTLGAKRYIYTDKDGLHATVAGCPKKAMVDYLSAQKDSYTAFNIGLKLDESASGKMCHHYTKPSETFVCTDYLGNKTEVTPTYGTSILPTSFEMNIAASFRDFICGVIPHIELNNSHRLNNARKLGKVNTFKQDYMERG